MFLDICPNIKRDRATLEKMIMRRVRRGTTILTDKWGGYIGFEGLGNIWFCHHFCLTLYSGMDYKHMTVNHANNFKDPITGVHTYGIEGRYWKHYLSLYIYLYCLLRWFCTKRKLPKSGGYDLELWVKHLLPGRHSSHSFWPPNTLM